MKGFENHGNTCYFNSAIQCLMSTPYLTDLFLKWDYPGESEVVREYQRLVRGYWEVENSSVDIKHLLSEFRKIFPEFSSGQHDSQEIIIKLFEIFEKEIPEDFVKKVFYGNTVQETVYPDGKSTTRSEFTTLMLQASENTDIVSLLKSYSSWNVLTDYKDDSGKVHNCATVRNMVTTVPPVFILCISMFPSKVRIGVPERVQISGVDFETFATCTHQGGLNGGHYISFTRIDKDWYVQNDTLVQKIEKFPTNDYHYVIMLKRKVHETHKPECPP